MFFVNVSYTSHTLWILTRYVLALLVKSNTIFVGSKQVQWLILPRLVEILKASDLASVSAKAVRKQLQQETTIDLDEHKKPLNALIAECFDKVNEEMQKDTSSSGSSGSSSSSSSDSDSESDNDTSLVTKAQTTTATKSSNDTSVKQTARKRKAEAQSTKKVTKKPRKPRQQDPAKREQNNFSRTWVLSNDLAEVTGEKEVRNDTHKGMGVIEYANMISLSKQH